MIANTKWYLHVSPPVIFLNGTAFHFHYMELLVYFLMIQTDNYWSRLIEGLRLGALGFSFQALVLGTL